MYQGKFSNKQRSGRSAPNSGQTISPELAELLRRADEPAADTALPETPAQPADQPEKAQKTKNSRKKATRSKGSPIVTTVFYTLWALMILTFLGGMYFVRGYTHNWLTAYELTRPDARAEQVFSAYFSDPDWSRIYDLAGIADTVFEDRDDFVAYMEENWAGKALSWQADAAGADGRSYLILCGDDVLGSFTLTDRTEQAHPIGRSRTLRELLDALEIFSDWQLSQVSIRFDRNYTIHIEKQNGHTAYVNGIAVSDDYTTRITSLTAEEFLPAGTDEFQTLHQTVSGLLREPEVIILDENGEQVELTLAVDTNTYLEVREEALISADELSIAQAAARDYGLFMIEKAGKANLAKTWRSTSDSYTRITTGQRWTGGVKDYTFTQESVSDYVSYNSRVFSARVGFTLQVTLNDGSTESFTLDSTLFFEKQKSGGWIAIAMTDEDIHRELVKVRLIFLDASGNAVSRSYVRTDADGFFAPSPAAPAGQVLTGWARVDSDGTATPIFDAGHNGYITLAPGTQLESMVLRPIFADAATEGGAA